MSVIALIDPLSLVGGSLRGALDTAEGLATDVRLLGSGSERAGSLTETGGEINIVQELSRDALEGTDVAVLCGDAPQRRAALEILGEDLPIVILADELERPPGSLRVVGVNDATPTAQHILVSPHPAVVLLAHLLAALGAHRPLRADGTFLLPASFQGNDGLDELFEQTRAILAFSGERAEEVFGQQLAFNLLPGPQPIGLEEQVRELLGDDIECNAQLLQSGVFHGLAASLLIEFEEAPELEALEASLDRSPVIERWDADRALGPIDAANHEAILIRPLTLHPRRPRVVWIWAVMDHLTVGSASNALAILREILATETVQ